eukprot:scaffold88236_cov20-Cyclotella_meneghiniana.AAC.2
MVFTNEMVFMMKCLAIPNLVNTRETKWFTKFIDKIYVGGYPFCLQIVSWLTRTIFYYNYVRGSIHNNFFPHENGWLTLESGVYPAPNVKLVPNNS